MFLPPEKEIMVVRKRGFSGVASRQCKVGIFFSQKLNQVSTFFNSESFKLLILLYIPVLILLFSLTLSITLELKWCKNVENECPNE